MNGSMVFPGPMNSGIAKRELFSMLFMYAHIVVNLDNHEGITDSDILAKGSVEAADALLEALEQASRTGVKNEY
jgi:hypothetical protein